MIAVAGAATASAAEYGGEVGADAAGQKLNANSRFNPDNALRLNTMSYCMTGDMWFKNAFNPNANGFVKIQAQYRPASFQKYEQKEKIIIREIYLDFLGDFCNMRIGKQYLKWGDGVFFNPADVINVSHDPLRPIDEAEGNPVAHVSFPIKSYATIDFLGVVRDGSRSFSDIPAVCRISSGVGPVGAFVYGVAQRHRKPVFGYDVNSVVAFTEETDAVIYAEGIFRRESDMKFVESDGTVSRRDSGRYWGTAAGMRINMKFPSLRRFDSWSFVAEYYRCNENWNASEYGNMYDNLPGNSGLGAYYAEFRGGRQYVYGGLSVSNAIFNYLTMECGAVLNCGDRSGIAMERVSYQYDDNTEIGSRGEVYFGKNRSEFGNAVTTRRVSGYAKISF